MPPFDDTTTAKLASITDAAILLQTIRTTYRQAKVAQAFLVRYQAATDPAFNAAVNAAYSGTERTELGAMLTQINNLCQDWEVNHAGAIGGVL